MALKIFENYFIENIQIACTYFVKIFFTQSNFIHTKSIYFFVGLMGCGKTFWGNKMATLLNYHCIDLDQVIEQQENLSIATIFNTKGEKYFRSIEYSTLLQIINTAQHNTIIATGGGTACFNNAISIMNSCGTTIWLNESITTIAARLQNETGKRPLLHNNTSLSWVEKLHHILQQRQQCYSLCKYIVSSPNINEKYLLDILKNEN